MSKAQRIGSLEIEPEAVQAHTIFYRIQQIGIVMIALLLLAAILGLFGSSLFGETVAENNSLRITYHKFARSQATTPFHIMVKVNEAPIKIGLSQSIFHTTSVKSITPSPASEEIIGDTIIYTFSVKPNKTPPIITMILKPESFGTIHGKMSLQNNVALSIHQFVYP